MTSISIYNQNMNYSECPDPHPTPIGIDTLFAKLEQLKDLLDTTIPINCPARPHFSKAFDRIAHLITDARNDAEKIFILQKIFQLQITKIYGEGCSTADPAIFFTKSTLLPYEYKKNELAAKQKYPDRFLFASCSETLTEIDEAISCFEESLKFYGAC